VLGENNKVGGWLYLVSREGGLPQSYDEGERLRRNLQEGRGNF